MFPQKSRYPVTLVAATLVGLVVRSGWLDWQPLWWDEGYSVYFATEPLQRMVWLTAHDIHPPLYYALLHGWLLALQNAQPIALRLFSVFMGVLSLPLLAWLAYLLFPQQPRRWVIATLLLLVNPLHLFYSQEVRMYALAMTLGLISTLCLWLTATQSDRKRRRLAWLGYVSSSVLAIYTLYYLAFLLLAHLLWLLGAGWRQPRRLWGYALAYGLITLLYAPWLLYAGRDLLTYVITDKIPADADQPLGPLTYLLRHLLAFTSGHVEPNHTLLAGLLWVGGVAVACMALVGMGDGLFNVRQGRHSRTDHPLGRALPNPHSLVWSCLLIPTLIGLLVNRNLPFFPQGGERLLLFILPYFLLLLSAGIDRWWQVWHLGRAVLTGVMLSAVTGLWLFYTTPRYVADDYRPVIRQITQQGQAGDTLLAIFPWQVGFWRAYAPVAACQLEVGQCRQLRGLDPSQAPTIALAGESALTWGPMLQTLIDQALDRGTLWLAAPLNLGSTLPAAIVAYVTEQQATPLEQRWVSSSTRLLAWRRLPRPPLTPLAIDFGPVQLTGAGILPTSVASANQPINVALQWQLGAQPSDLGVTLRLQDSAGHTWTSRDYQPLGSHPLVTGSQSLTEQSGLVIPVGLPPATYQVLLGVTLSGTEQLLAPAHLLPEQGALVALGLITVTQPAAPLPAFQLPIQKFAQIDPSQAIAVLGYAGNLVDRPLLAGEGVDLTLFLQARQRVERDQQLYVSLLDAQGAGVAGWEGWTPAQWRSSQWPRGALVQAPLRFDTAATLPSGAYQLIAGLLDPTSGRKSPPTVLDQVEIRQRAASFTLPAIPQPLDSPARFGTHADLLGYALERQPDHLDLTLYWQVQQTLLPPHQIFVHLDDDNGTTLAQADGPPYTAAGPAPTGTWQAGEYVLTVHRVALSFRQTDRVGLHLQVGLYLPGQGSRLPVTQKGVATGDAVQIPLP